MSELRIIDQLPDAVLVRYPGDVISDCNPAALALLELAPGEFGLTPDGDMPWQLFTDADEKVLVGQGPLSRAMRGECVRDEYRLVTARGSERWVDVSATPFRDTTGRIVAGLMVMRDISEQRRAEQALRESENRYRRLVELCPDPIIVHCDGRLVFANAAAFDLIGASSHDDMMGQPILKFVDPSQHQLVIDRVRTAIERQESAGTIELTLIRLDGEYIWTESTTMPVQYRGRPAIQVVMRDVTERKRAEEALAHQALHDALTGLPNRVLLFQRLTELAAESDVENSQLGLLLMDLDRFKEVNDTLGHQAGDLLLQQVGARLSGSLARADTIARLGGDEFAVIVPHTDETQLRELVDSLLGALNRPFELEGQPVSVGASIGMALLPQHGRAADILLRRADVAMYVAKRGGGGAAMYQPEQDRHSPDRLALIGELRRAIEHGDLELHYQPKIDLRTGRLSGVEALARWQHPLRGLIAPDQFIPLAEQAGLIDALSRSVLAIALRQVRAWRRAGLEIPVAVNLSMRNVQQQDLPGTISALLAESGVPPRLLSLEITESTLMADPVRTATILEQLRAMGIEIAIDDFGTGHSSLVYLKHLPVDELKIDRSFIRDISKDASDRVIVRATINLAHSLGLRVVAEGVEDSITHGLLAELGCDQAQGYHISRPLRAQAVTHWLWQLEGAQSAAA